MPTTDNTVAVAIVSAIFPAKVDIPLETIKTLSQGKHGFNKNVLQLETTKGKNYRFLLREPFDNWLEAIKSALSTYHQLQLVKTEEEKWIVQRQE